MDYLKKIINQINHKDYARALELCDLSENLNNKDIIFNIKGSILYFQKKFNLAEINFIKSHNINKNLEDPIKNLYILYFEQKKFKELIVWGKKLIELDKTNESHNYRYALACELNQIIDEAIKYYNNTIALNGKNKYFALNNLGSIFLRLNKLELSIKYFLNAYNLGFKNKTVINNILLNYIKLRDENKANFFFKEAEKIDKDFILFIYNKSELLILKNNIREALDILEKYKNNIDFLVRLIRLKYEIGNTQEASKLFYDNLEKIKKINKFYFYISSILLYDGHFDDGWKYYEYRSSNKIDFFKSTPVWDGQDIKNNNIIVYNDQGIGDAIQFSKYLLQLLKISKSISFVVSENIIKLFKNNIKNLDIGTKNSIINKSYDYKISLGSLIKHFYKDNLDHDKNLIKINDEKFNYWNVKINKNKLNVGLAWSGSLYGPNQPYSSIPLNTLSRVINLNANFYCLQNFIWPRDQDFFKTSKIIDFSKFNLEEIAAIIKNLDIVISVDTSILHLASSLNCETWGIFSLNSEWRWGKFFELNPYRTLKVFKQNKFNDWTNVENEILMKLHKRIELKNYNKSY